MRESDNFYFHHVHDHFLDLNSDPLRIAMREQISNGNMITENVRELKTT